MNVLISQPKSLDVLDYCDKQRILEVRRYNQGRCCYSFDSRRANMIIDHTLNIRHHSLQEIMHVPNYSSVKFSLHYQSAVYSTRIHQTSLDLTESDFNLDDSVDGGCAHHVDATKMDFESKFGIARIVICGRRFVD